MAKPGGGMSSAYCALGLLGAIAVLNYIDRTIPSILAEPMKRELGLSDTAIGLINGAGFLIVYALASIPLARLSDSGRYRTIIIFTLALWSLMTLLAGLAVTGWQVALCRMGVAFGEAGGVPAAHAYISRHFSPAHRATALSIFTMSMPIGSVVGFGAGGVGGEYLGWRWTLVLLGGVGLGLAAVSHFVLSGTGNTVVPKKTTHRYAMVAKRGMFRKRSFWATVVGTSFIGMGGYTAVTFTPAFLMRSHQLSIREAGLAFGAGGGVSSVLGLLLVAWATHRLSSRDPRWLLRITILAIVICLPFSATAFFASNLWLALLGVALNHTISIATSAPIFAAIHHLAPVERRAQASAVLLVASATLGGLGPLIAGKLSDLNAADLGAESLGYALLIVPAAFTLAAMSFGYALTTFHEEVESD